MLCARALVFLWRVCSAQFPPIEGVRRAFALEKQRCFKAESNVSSCLRTLLGGDQVGPLCSTSSLPQRVQTTLPSLFSTGVSVFEKDRLQAWQKNSEWGINLALPHHKTILAPA